jgi:hypothetical protein
MRERTRGSRIELESAIELSIVTQLESCTERSCNIHTRMCDSEIESESSSRSECEARQAARRQGESRQCSICPHKSPKLRDQGRSCASRSHTWPLNQHSEMSSSLSMNCSGQDCSSTRVWNVDDCKLGQRSERCSRVPLKFRTIHMTSQTPAAKCANNGEKSWKIIPQKCR